MENTYTYHEECAKDMTLGRNERAYSRGYILGYDVSSLKYVRIKIEENNHALRTVPLHLRSNFNYAFLCGLRDGLYAKRKFLISEKQKISS